MSNKPTYTPEQVAILAQNPYTHSVTQYSIKFTLEFKQFFVSQMNKPGMTTPKILNAAGYDSHLFTRSVMDHLRKELKKQASSPTGLKPPTGLSQVERTAVFAAKDLSKQRTQTSINELQDRIVHLEEQVEFLKKISQLKTPT